MLSGNRLTSTNFAPSLLLSIVPVTHGAPAFDCETHAMNLAKHFLQSDEILLTRSDLISALFAMGFANGISKNVFEAPVLISFLRYSRWVSRMAFLKTCSKQYSLMDSAPLSAKHSESAC
jgi:hypothetical protein